MPENIYEWSWFVFFTVGSLGGWVFAAIFFATIWQEVRKRKAYNFKKQVPKSD